MKDRFPRLALFLFAFIVIWFGCREPVEDSKCIRELKECVHVASTLDGTDEVEFHKAGCLRVYVKCAEFGWGCAPRPTDDSAITTPGVYEL